MIKLFGITVGIVVALAIMGCGTIKVDSSHMVLPHSETVFLAGDTAGAAIHVAIDPSQLKFKSKAEEAEFQAQFVNFPSFGKIDVWLLYNVMLADVADDYDVVVVEPIEVDAD